MGFSVLLIYDIIDFALFMSNNMSMLWRQQGNFDECRACLSNRKYTDDLEPVFFVVSVLLLVINRLEFNAGRYPVKLPHGRYLTSTIHKLKMRS